MPTPQKLAVERLDENRADSIEAVIGWGILVLTLNFVVWGQFYSRPTMPKDLGVCEYTDAGDPSGGIGQLACDEDGKKQFYSFRLSHPPR